MKNILLLFVLAALFIFPSCKYVGNLQVEKRHYGKGYYVHHSGDRSETKTAVDENAVALKEENVPVATELVLNENSDQTIPSDQATVPEKQTVAGTSKTTTTHSAKKEPNAVKNNPAPKTNHASKTIIKKPVHSAGGGDVDQILLLILAILISPLAVLLKEGTTKRFWIDLVCWLLGLGFFLSPFFYGGALMLFAVVYAILIVFDVI